MGGRQAAAIHGELNPESWLGGGGTRVDGAKTNRGKLFLFVLFFLRVNSFNTPLEIMETAFIYDDSRVTTTAAATRVVKGR